MPVVGKPVGLKTYREEYHALVEEDGEPFWLDPAWRDVIAALAIGVIVLALAIWPGPKGLGEIADPIVLRAHPRPDWNFPSMFTALALMHPDWKTAHHPRTCRHRPRAAPGAISRRQGRAALASPAVGAGDHRCRRGRARGADGSRRSRSMVSGPESGSALGKRYCSRRGGGIDSRSRDLPVERLSQLSSDRRSGRQEGSRSDRCR